MGAAELAGAARATIYATWTAWQARLVLIVLVLLCALCVAASVGPSARPVAAAVVDPDTTDVALYRAVAARVGSGETYYSAVVAEQRAREFPLRPFVTVRLPTLAWLTGYLGERAAGLLVALLAVAAIIGTTLRMRAATTSPVAWAAATMLAAGSMALLALPAMVWWHDGWGGLLIALSLACRRPGRWRTSVLIGLAAVLVRELALPYLCLMAALAWWDGQRREAIAWTGAILLFITALAAHGMVLAQHVTALDAASPGWSSAGGLPFVLGLVQRCTIWTLLPLPAVALALPLALLGWSGLAGGYGRRVALLLGGYLVAFLLFGRSDNFYWGLMIAPLLAAGLAFVPSAIRDLVTVALDHAGGAARPAT